MSEILELIFFILKGIKLFQIFEGDALLSFFAHVINSYFDFLVIQCGSNFVYSFFHFF